MDNAISKNQSPIIYASLDRLLYEDKEMSYGGYSIRNKKDDIILRSFYVVAIIILSLMAVFFMTHKYHPFDPVEKIGEFNPVEPPVMTVEYPVMPEPPAPEPPSNTQPAAPTPPDPSPVTTVANPIPEPDPDPNNNETPLDQSEFANVDPGATTTTGTGKFQDPVLPPGGTGTGTGTGGINTDIEFTDIDVGKAPMATNLEAVKAAIRYPKMLADIGLEGSVVMRVLVSADGKILKHEVLKTRHNLFTEACEKELNKLQFTPGKMGEIPVKVWVILPFTFTIAR